MQRALDRERDTATNGTGGSMSASLRGSNSSLNSMPGSVISTCGCLVYNCMKLISLLLTSEVLANRFSFADLRYNSKRLRILTFSLRL